MFWLAIASRQDICARSARLAARVTAFRDSDAYQIGDLVKTAKARRKATVLGYAPTSYPKLSARGDVDGEIRKRVEEVHCGAMALAGWSDAAHGDQTSEGRRRPGYPQPCGVSVVSANGSPSSPGNPLKSSLGAEAYAFSEMMGRMALLRELHAPFADLALVLAGLEVCEYLSTHLRRKKTVAEKYLARRIIGIQRALENGELSNVVWFRRPENRAGGRAPAESDMVPLLRLLRSGSFSPGPLRPPRGLTFVGETSAWYVFSVC